MPSKPSNSLLTVTVLTKRADFVRLGKRARRVGCETLVLQADATPEAAREDDRVRVGFTATKRQGNAVVRNRIKRRLRAAVREIMPELGVPGSDYVLVGKEATAGCDYALILRDLRYALRKAETIATSAAPPRRSKKQQRLQEKQRAQASG